MSSRAGDLDPGVVTYLARVRHLSVEQVDDLLTRQSGLLALSGRSADMRDLLTSEASDARARLAVDTFCYQVRKWIGAFAAALGGLDTLVFSGGIGEHAPAIRDRVCDGLAFLGVTLDRQRNETDAAVISALDARVRVHVIPTDEALMMAREAYAVLVDAEDTRVLGAFLRDVVSLNQQQRNFRLFGPDETVSNRLDAVFETTARQMWR